jgi:hypothetical protein
MVIPSNYPSVATPAASVTTTSAAPVAALVSAAPGAAEVAAAPAAPAVRARVTPAAIAPTYPAPVVRTSAPGTRSGACSTKAMRSVAQDAVDLGQRPRNPADARVPMQAEPLAHYSLPPVPMLTEGALGDDAVGGAPRDRATTAPRIDDQEDKANPAEDHPNGGSDNGEVHRTAPRCP